MKKIITLIAACLMLPAMAQEIEFKEISAPSQQEQLLVYENPQIPVYIGNITYEPHSKGEKAKGVLTGLLNNEISIEDEGMVAGAKEALATSLRYVNRFFVKTGEVSAEDMGNCLVFSANIIFCNFTEKLNNRVMDKEARIVAYITLTDPKTNRVCYSTQVSSVAWLSVFNTIAQCREWTQSHLLSDAAWLMRRAYPLRGHMLEKGFEKGKKQKLKEIYIDLGTDNRIFTDSHVDVYTVKRVAGRIARQYIGSAKVLEVQGNDISICKVTKNAEQIKKAFDRGAEIAVQVY